jgi:hypothetical protein
MSEVHAFYATLAGISVEPAAAPIPAGFTMALDFTAALSARLSPASGSVV